MFRSNYTPSVLTNIAVSASVSLIILLIIVSVAFAYRDAVFKAFFERGAASVSSDERGAAYATTTPHMPGDKRYEAKVVDAVSKATPAVVSIAVTKNVPVIERYYTDPFAPGAPFEFRVPQYRQEGTREREVGNGSGFLVSADGYVVTNKHVVSEGDDVSYTVFTGNGKKYAANVIARDPTFDIAVLDIEGNDHPHLSFGDSQKLQLGQSVIAIGNALGEFRNTVSTGVISGLSRSIVAGASYGRAARLNEVIQTDAAINPGNSGGPLLNLAGEVIGVNVAMARGSENIGFAIPASVVADIVTSVQEHGEIIRPYLGVRYRMITDRLKKIRDLPVDHGALIVAGRRGDRPAVAPDSPAEHAGLETGDIIRAVDGTSLKDGHTLATEIRKKEVGQRISLRVLRDGSERTVTVRLARFPEE